MPTICETCKAQACDICITRPTNKCGMKTEIFSRVCGYHRPVKNWNKGQQERFKNTKYFDLDKKGIFVTKEWPSGRKA